ncbi:MAG: hypothetical protein KAW12_26925, partial [Candidatus Aminicenantes bacterium]|nr:hypothetical protein [Candidatus Aminicenantes bacterium]
MKSIKRKSIFGIITGILIVFCFSINSFGYFFLNGSDGLYSDEGNEKTVNIKSNLSIGASYYLRGCSDIQSFLNLIELQDLNGINYEELSSITNDVYANIKTASDLYDLIINDAKISPINDEFKAKLTNFDYTGFAKEYGLNIVIFKECENYLQQGDMIGVFTHTHSKLLEILGILDSIKSEIGKSRLPALSVTWELNE